VQYVLCRVPQAYGKLLDSGSDVCTHQRRTGQVATWG